MCTSSAPIVSEFNSITHSTPTTIEGNDIMAGGTVTLSFWEPGTTVCIGESMGGDHYYDLPIDEQDQILACLAAGKKIQIKARYVGSNDYIRVDWKAART